MSPIRVGTDQVMSVSNIRNLGNSAFYMDADAKVARLQVTGFVSRSAAVGQW